jgi:hypothetical protein
MKKQGISIDLMSGESISVEIEGDIVTLTEAEIVGGV